MSHEQACNWMRTVFFLAAAAALFCCYVVLSAISWLPFWAIGLIAMPLGWIFGYFMMGYFHSLEFVRKPYDKGNIGTGDGIATLDLFGAYAIYTGVPYGLLCFGKLYRSTTSVGAALLRLVHENDYGIWLLCSILIPTGMTVLMVLMVKRDRALHPRNEGQPDNETP